MGLRLPFCLFIPKMKEKPVHVVSLPFHRSRVSCPLKLTTIEEAEGYLRGEFPPELSSFHHTSVLGVFSTATSEGLCGICGFSTQLRSWWERDDSGCLEVPPCFIFSKHVCSYHSLPGTTLFILVIRRPWVIPYRGPEVYILAQRTFRYLLHPVWQHVIIPTVIETSCSCSRKTTMPWVTCLCKEIFADVQSGLKMPRFVCVVSPASYHEDFGSVLFLSPLQCICRLPLSPLLASDWTSLFLLSMYNRSQHILSERKPFLLLDW